MELMCDSCLVDDMEGEEPQNIQQSSCGPGVYRQTHQGTSWGLEKCRKGPPENFKPATARTWLSFSVFFLAAYICCCLLLYLYLEPLALFLYYVTLFSNQWKQRCLPFVKRNRHHWLQCLSWFERCKEEVNWMSSLVATSNDGTGSMYTDHRVFFFKKTSNLFIFNHDSTTNTKNKNYIQIRRPPSDDYKHRSEPKARHRHCPSIAGVGHNLL